MTRQQFIDEHKYTILGMLAECQTAGKRDGKDIARESDAYRDRVMRMLGELYDKAFPPVAAASPIPPSAPLRNGVPPATQSQVPVPRGK